MGVCWQVGDGEEMECGSVGRLVRGRRWYGGLWAGGEGEEMEWGSMGRWVRGRRWNGHL